MLEIAPQPALPGDEITLTYRFAPCAGPTHHEQVVEGNTFRWIIDGNLNPPCVAAAPPPLVFVWELGTLDAGTYRMVLVENGAVTDSHILSLGYPTSIPATDTSALILMGLLIGIGAARKLRAR